MIVRNVDEFITISWLNRAQTDGLVTNHSLKAMLLPCSSRTCTSKGLNTYMLNRLGLQTNQEHTYVKQFLVATCPTL